jgi:RimJ/RimL family protein N-acetyltransferase
MELLTDRLFIRQVQSEDIESMFNYRSDADTSKYLSLIPDSVEDVEAFINKTSPLINIPATWFQCAIFEKASNLLIGDIGLHFLENDSENSQVEIGCTLDRKFRGKGYATESLTAVIDYLFYSLKKHRIIASVDPSNTDSIKLVERLGFRREAHFVESLFFQGKWVDDLVYALLAKEWKHDYRMDVSYRYKLS